MNASLRAQTMKATKTGFGVTKTGFGLTIPLSSSPLTMSLFLPEPVTAAVASVSYLPVPFLSLPQSAQASPSECKVSDWKEEAEEGGEREKMRTHDQGKKNIEPQCVRGVNRFFLCSTMIFDINW